MEAIKGPDKEHCIPLATNEVMILIKRGSWVKAPREVVLQHYKTNLKTKWVFKKKHEQDGSI